MLFFCKSRGTPANFVPLYATEVLYWLVLHGYPADEEATETLGEWLEKRPSYAAVAAAA